MPFINAVCRSGTPEEKEFIFKAMCDKWSDTLVENSKRGHKGETCYWYEEAVTLADRIKRRQSDIQKQEEDICKERIEEDNALDKPVLLVKLEADEGEPNINGLVANELQAKYQKPSAVVIKHKTERGTVWTGSMRNYGKSPVKDFKKVINDTGLAKSEGHPSAASFVIEDKNIDSFMEKMEKVYKKVDQTPTYWIDYYWSQDQVKNNNILEIAGLNIYGQNIPESLVEVHDIDLSSVKKDLLGKDKNTIKLTFSNGCAIMFFRENEVLYNKFCQDNMVLDVVGKCNRNQWLDTVTPQIIVEDFDIREDFIF